MNAEPPPFVYEAPATCPSADDFRGRVRGWLANASPPASANDEALRGGTLRLREAADHEVRGEATLPRTNVQRALHAATCEELVAAYAFVFAVDLDERVLDRAGDTPPAPIPAAPTPAPTPASTPAPPPAPGPPVVEPPSVGERTNDPPPLRLVWTVALLSGAASGLLPSTAYRESAEIEAYFARASRWSPRVRLGLDVDLPVDANPGAGYQARFTDGALRLDVCPFDVARRSPVFVSICARVAVAAVFASGAEGPDVHASTRYVPSVALAPRAAIPIGTHVTIGIDMSLGVPFVRDRYTLEDGTLFVTRTALLTESAQAFFAWTF